MLKRIRVLITGRTVWVDPDGNEEVEHLPWKLRWTLFGIHARNWRWVNHWGKRDCGCTINPITRQRVWIDWDCRKHSHKFRRRSNGEEE